MTAGEWVQAGIAFGLITLVYFVGPRYLFPALQRRWDEREGRSARTRPAPSRIYRRTFVGVAVVVIVTLRLMGPLDIAYIWAAAVIGLGLGHYAGRLADHLARRSQG
jgi:hypothetical protein